MRGRIVDNFAGGGGNCGYHAALFAGLAAAPATADRTLAICAVAQAMRLLGGCSHRRAALSDDG